MTLLAENVYTLKWADSTCKPSKNLFHINYVVTSKLAKVNK